MNPLWSEAAADIEVLKSLIRELNKRYDMSKIFQEGGKFYLAHQVVELVEEDAKELYEQFKTDVSNLEAFFQSIGQTPPPANVETGAPADNPTPAQVDNPQPTPADPAVPPAPDPAVQPPPPPAVDPNAPPVDAGVPTPPPVQQPPVDSPATPADPNQVPDPSAMAIQ